MKRGSQISLYCKRRYVQYTPRDMCIWNEQQNNFNDDWESKNKVKQKECRMHWYENWFHLMWTKQQNKNERNTNSI